MSIILEEGNYRVTAHPRSEPTVAPPSWRSEALLGRIGDVEWTLAWEGRGTLDVSIDELIHAANFLDGDCSSIRDWLEYRSIASEYHVSKHNSPKTSETFLYVVKIPHKNFDPNDSNIVHWALGNIYDLELTRIDTGEVLNSKVVCGLGKHAEDIAHQMISDLKTEERSNTACVQARIYIENANDVIERFLRETDPDRRKFLMEELNYWLSKSVEALT